MAIPTHEEAMLPVLRLLADGKTLDRRTIADRVADELKLTEDERAAMLPSGKSTFVRSRVGWALTYLRAASALKSPKRGLYEISDRGKSILAKQPTTVDNEYLRQFPEFVEFTSRTKDSDQDSTTTTSSAPVVAATSVSAATPEEHIAQVYDDLRFATEAELLEAVKVVKPEYFEQIVIDLLVKMGYGGSREEAARVVGKSGDEGIDGIIDEDRLGLGAIYIQAKRWQGTVGRPEIQKFAGALQGQKAHKGVFITTSNFTREAKDFARSVNISLVLIDGPRLASLMFEFDLGVTPRRTYVVKSIDSDYFDEG